MSLHMVSNKDFSVLDSIISFIKIFQQFNDVALNVNTPKILDDYITFLYLTYTVFHLWELDIHRCGRLFQAEYLPDLRGIRDAIELGALFVLVVATIRT